MITVAEARARLLQLVAPGPAEQVTLGDAAGRVLAEDVFATRDQPPFAASSMDGYALRSDEVERHAMFRVVGEAAAGKRFSGSVRPGQAVRIFTGAPMPDGTDCVVIQEDVTRKGDVITISDDPGTKSNVRPAGVDFSVGSKVSAPRLLSHVDIALLAAMNVAFVPVVRRPVVALIATGDELVMPGEDPGPDQIVASNTFGLRAMLASDGAELRMLPIARDSEASLRTAFGLAAGADLVVTVGGASVGEHDLVAPVAEALGLERSFYKIRMRPGKPLMAGRMGDAAMVGLPGNPVSAMVCGYLFLRPMMRRMLGLDPGPPQPRTASLTAAIAANGPREHYMRAHVEEGHVTVFDNQDSSLLSVLAAANALVIRPPDDPARAAGDIVRYLSL